MIALLYEKEFTLSAMELYISPQRKVDCLPYRNILDAAYYVLYTSMMEFSIHNLENEVENVAITWPWPS